ncbi:MAG: rhomboid family intramembrane serine protease [Planctomycetaceae bacterium]|nr:rhomboid family intramembrane serine protease [Planctomycetaceae bacterium]
MLIPVSTDAPIYHFPWGTIVLIVANVVCFVVNGGGYIDDGRLEPWMLEYGNGINPLEWLSSMFAHHGAMHLIGNMIFLWGFGLVVEGKLGFRRFLTLYLAIGLTQGALVDLLTLHRTDAFVLKHVIGPEFGIENIDELADLIASDEIPQQQARLYAAEIIQAARGRCLGASGAIFGVMAVALVWAPKNDMSVLMFLAFRVFFFDISIMWYSILYFGMNLFGVLVDRFEMDTSGLHILGAIVGFGAGVVYLKKDWVDCENWDLFAVLSGKYGRFAQEDWALGAHGRPDKDYSKIPLPGEAVEEDPEPPASTAQSAGSRKRQKEPVETSVGAPAFPVTRNMRPIANAIDEGDFMGASNMLFELRMVDSSSMLDPDRLKALSLGLVRANVLEEAEVYLQEYIERFPDDNIWATLRLAHILITAQSRPSAGLEMLRTLKGKPLSDQQKDQARKLMNYAKKQIAQGVQDAEPEW